MRVAKVDMQVSGEYHANISDAIVSPILSLGCLELLLIVIEDLNTLSSLVVPFSLENLD